MTTHVTPAPVAAGRSSGHPGRPLLAAAAAAGTCVLVNVVDPNVEGALGTCPFRALTGGLDCPGCGLLRCTRALTRGDLLLALDHNALVVVLLPLLVATLVGWWRFERGTTPVRWAPPPAVGVAIAVAIPLFWVARTTPIAPWLASGVG